MAVVLKGTDFVSGSTITIPSHNAGDLIIILAVRLSGLTAAVPSAGGTVPNWTTLYQTGFVGSTSNMALTVGYAVATGSDTTSGTWTSASRMSVAVISGQGNNFIGGKQFTLNNTSNNVGMSAPAITQSKTDGSSLLLHAVFSSPTSLSYNVPSGYTGSINTSVVNVALLLCTKNSSTSDGSVGVSINGGTYPSVYAGASIEILAPSKDSGFFAMF